MPSQKLFTAPLLEPQLISVVTWVRKTQPAPVSATLVGKGTDAGCRPAYGLLTGAEGNVRFEVQIRTTEGVTQRATVATPGMGQSAVWDGQWHALAGVYDGSEVAIYLDGNRVAARSLPFIPNALDYDVFDDRALTVGRQGTGCSTAPFSGQVDEVQIYDRAITAQEIAYLHNPSATQPPVLPMPTPTPTPTPTPPRRHADWDPDGDADWYADGDTDGHADGTPTGTPTVTPVPTPVVCPGDATPTPSRDGHTVADRDRDGNARRDS